MEKEYTCFFTGHRILPQAKRAIIDELLTKSIINLIENKGVTDFIAGGARGFDMLAARAVLRIKEQYPYIKLHMYYPCHNQWTRWPYNERYEWQMIKALCDSFIFVTPGEYTPDCMQKRNKKMVDDAYYGICFCIKDGTGTGATMKYAKASGRNIENIADMIYEQEF